mgnify:CR=1 FL=1
MCKKIGRNKAPKMGFFDEKEKISTFLCEKFLFLLRLVCPKGRFQKPKQT